MFFFVLSSLGRSSISVGFFERPLFAALLFGLVTNEIEFALLLGLIFELFWLDALRLGAVIPPSATLSFTILYPLNLIFSWQTPAQFVVPLLICLPLAYLVKGVELFQRKQANAYIADVEAWAEQPLKGLNPQKIIFKSLRKFILLYTVLYGTLFFVMYILFSFLTEHGLIPMMSKVSWSLLFMISLVGAVLALRTKQAYAIILLAVICIFLYERA